MFLTVASVVLRSGNGAALSPSQHFKTDQLNSVFNMRMQSLETETAQTHIFDF